MLQFAIQIIIIFFTVSLMGCSSGTSTGGDSEENTTSNVTNDLDTVSQNFTPNSLESDSNTTSALVKYAEGEDPCAESEDLYDCQPVLLRMYLAMAQDFLDMTKDIVEEIGLNLGELPDGSQGIESIEGETIHYSKESSSNFSIILEGTTGPMAYFDIAETVYTLQMDLDNLEEAGDASGKLEIVVNYESETSWSIDIFILGMDCDASDPRAPERIYIQVTRSGDFWIGKAMFYNGRWLADTASCEIEESDENSINFYTDFVANEIAARASVYMMSRSKNDLSDIENFGMDQFSINFSQQDDNTSDYQNPFCNPASTLDALWNDDCSSIDSSVGSTDYGPSSDWILPSDFYQQTITLPSSL